MAWQEEVEGAGVEPRAAPSFALRGEGGSSRYGLISWPQVGFVWARSRAGGALGLGCCASPLGSLCPQIRLPSGQCLRERFPADCLLQDVTQHLSTLHPDLPPFTLLQGFPKRRFGPAELSCSLQALGLTPSATLCVLATEPLPSGTCALAAPQARDGPLQPPGPQALPTEEHAWGRGETLGLVLEQAMAEGMFPEAEELRLALSSPARRVVPGKPGLHGLWESTSPPHHRWGKLPACWSGEGPLGRRVPTWLVRG